MWALEGLRRLRSQGRFTVPASSTPVIGEFRRAISPVTEFAEDCCELDTEQDWWVQKSMLFDMWMAWAKDHGLYPGPRSRFGQRFMACFPSCESGRQRVRGQEVGVYRHARLTEAALLAEAENRLRRRAGCTHRGHSHPDGLDRRGWHPE